jgi:hypothetical protein
MCTTKIRKLLKIADHNLHKFSEHHGDTLREWYCNLFYLSRHKCLLFTQANTLFSILVPGIGVDEIRNIGEIFRMKAPEVFAAEEITAQQILRLIDSGPDLYARAENRSVLGSMNDHIRTCKFYLEYNGGYDNLNFTELNRELNLTPMKYIGMESAGENLLALLNSDNYK